MTPDQAAECLLNALFEAWQDRPNDFVPQTVDRQLSDSGSDCVQHHLDFNGSNSDRFVSFFKKEKSS